MVDKSPGSGEVRVNCHNDSERNRNLLEKRWTG